MTRCVMDTTRSYACAIQAGLTRLGSNVMRTSKVLLPLCARRATLVSLLPWCRILQRRSAVQGCPQKPIPIAGAQLCSWNTRRKLYQKVGNFVGSVVSPILANGYVHYALDLWFEYVVKKHSKGAVSLYRYADGTPVQA
jgi:hypothetical protein